MPAWARPARAAGRPSRAREATWRPGVTGAKMRPADLRRRGSAGRRRSGRPSRRLAPTRPWAAPPAGRRAVVAHPVTRSGRASCPQRHRAPVPETTAGGPWPDRPRAPRAGAVACGGARRAAAGRRRAAESRAPMALLRPALGLARAALRAAVAGRLRVPWTAAPGGRADPSSVPDRRPARGLGLRRSALDGSVDPAGFPDAASGTRPGPGADRPGRRAGRGRSAHPGRWAHAHRVHRAGRRASRAPLRRRRRRTCRDPTGACSTYRPSRSSRPCRPCRRGPLSLLPGGGFIRMRLVLRLR
jgi:hypothetical protein